MTSPYSPPEITSAQMHQGAGTASLEAAAQQWGGVADHLDTASAAVSAVSAQTTKQHWQGPAAQQMHRTTEHVTHVLHVNAAVATQTQTALNTVTIAFQEAQAHTATPDKVAANRQTMTQLISTNRFGKNAPAIAETEDTYQTMWAENTNAAIKYHYEASQAIEQIDPWQELAVNTQSTIQQHRENAVRLRQDAIDHAVAAQKHRDAKEQQKTFAKELQPVADNDNATARHCDNMARLHREAAQTHRDLSRGYSEVNTLAEKYYQLFQEWWQTKQHIKKMIGSLSDFRERIGEEIEYDDIMSSFPLLKLRDETTALENILGINVEWPLELQNYVDRFQPLSEEVSRGAYVSDIDVQRHQNAASHFENTATKIRNYTLRSPGALRPAEAVNNAWLNADNHEKKMIDDITNSVLRTETSRLQDRLADELEKQIDAPL